MTQQDGRLDVICLGIYVVDALAKPIEKMPDWRQLEIIQHMELQTGGCANNTGTGLARLGMKVGAIGRIGGDIFGDFVLKHLANEGIDATALRRDESCKTSFTFVMIAPDGERAFFHYVGANGTFCSDDVDFEKIANARLLHVAGTFVMPGIDGEPTARLLKKTRELGVTTCLDTVWNSSIDTWATLKPCLPYLDYFLPSIDEARLMTGHESPSDVAKFFLDHGVGTIGLKMGAEGSYVANQETEVRVPAFQTNVIDTTGAGDAWVAGFLTGRLKGMGLEESGRLGSAMGALCASATGTTAGLKSFEETFAFMKSARPLQVYLPSVDS